MLFPHKKYVCEVGKNIFEEKGVWDKGWWAVSRMRADWKGLAYAEKEFLNWQIIRAQTLEEMRCCVKANFQEGSDRTQMYECKHARDDKFPIHFGCCKYNSGICRVVHDDFVKASVNFDIARCDEKMPAYSAPKHSRSADKMVAPSAPKHPRYMPTFQKQLNFTSLKKKGF